MKKTMKLTYLLTLLLLLFSFTACGDSDDKKTTEKDTKVEKTEDTESKEDTEDTEDTEDAKDTEDTEDTEDAKDTEDTEDTSSEEGKATVGDLTYSVDPSWTLDSSDSTGATYLLPSADGTETNNLMVMLTDVGGEITDEYLVANKDQFIQQYESMNAPVTSESTIETACGTALVFTVDATKMLEASGITGYTAYIKQVIVANGTKTYIFQLTCLGDDFATLESEFDAVISSIEK